MRDFVYLMIISAMLYLALDQYAQRLAVEREFIEFVDNKVAEDIKTQRLVDMLAKKKARRSGP
jgi:hypothetical protein